MNDNFAFEHIIAKADNECGKVLNISLRIFEKSWRLKVIERTQRGTLLIY